MRKKKAKKRHPGKTAISLLLLDVDHAKLGRLAKRLSDERGSRVHTTDLLREGYRMVFAKYNAE